MQTSRTTRRLALTTLAGVGLQAAAPALHAQRPVQLRVGSLVPKNSLYHQSLMELGETWRAAQGGSARFTVFTDGSQGGEAEMARRMRIGQLQGALMSVVGLREIEPTVAAMQSLPLLFRNWEEVDHVRVTDGAAMVERIERRLADPFRGRTDIQPLGRHQLAAPQGPGDDTHGGAP